MTKVEIEENINKFIVLGVEFIIEDEDLSFEYAELSQEQEQELLAFTRDYESEIISIIIEAEEFDALKGVN